MKRVVILCVWLFSVVAGHAQLSLDECRRLARENYPEIRQYDLVHQTEQYNLSNAARAWIPQLAFSAQATWQTDAPNFPKELTGMLAQQGLEIPGLRKDQYKVALELNQTIWDGGKSVADKRIARAEAAEQKTMTDVDLYELEGRVDDLYFGILLLDERIAQTNLTLNLLRSNLEKVRALQRNGVAMQSDADVLEAELLSVGQQLIQFESSYVRHIHRTKGGRSKVAASQCRTAPVGRIGTSRVGYVRSEDRQAYGARKDGKIVVYAPLGIFCSGILWLSGIGLYAEYDE